jgi:hypothetical protein
LPVTSISAIGAMEQGRRLEAHWQDGAHQAQLACFQCW